VIEKRFAQLITLEKTDNPDDLLMLAGRANALNQAMQVS